MASQSIERPPKKARVEKTNDGTELVRLFRALGAAQTQSLVLRGVLTFEDFVALSDTCRALARAIPEITDWYAALREKLVANEQLHAELAPKLRTADRATGFAILKRVATSASYFTCGVCWKREHPSTIPGNWLLFEKCAVRHCNECFGVLARARHPQLRALCSYWYFGVKTLHRLRLPKRTTDKLYVTPQEARVHEGAGEALFPTPPRGMRIGTGRRAPRAFYNVQIDRYHREVLVYMLCTRGSLAIDTARRVAADIPLDSVFKKSVNTLDAVWRNILVGGCVTFMTTKCTEQDCD